MIRDLEDNQHHCYSHSFGTRYSRIHWSYAKFNSKKILAIIMGEGSIMHPRHEALTFQVLPLIGGVMVLLWAPISGWCIIWNNEPRAAYITKLRQVAIRTHNQTTMTLTKYHKSLFVLIPTWLIQGGLALPSSYLLYLYCGICTIYVFKYCKQQHVINDRNQPGIGIWEWDSRRGGALLFIFLPIGSSSFHMDWAQYQSTLL